MSDANEAMSAVVVLIHVQNVLINFLAAHAGLSHAKLADLLESTRSDMASKAPSPVIAEGLIDGIIDGLRHQATEAAALALLRETTPQGRG